MCVQDLFMEIDREEFEFEVSPLFDRCMAHVAALLEEAKISPVRFEPPARFQQRD